MSGSAAVERPLLWGPAPTQHPRLYVAVSRVLSDGAIIDEYETRFGIRSLEFDPEKGLMVNGEAIRIQGVNQHHDLRDGIIWASLLAITWPGVLIAVL